MPKHALPRSRRLGQLRIAATAVLVIAFLTLFVGGATGMIGRDGDDEDGGSGAQSAQADAPADGATDPAEPGGDGTRSGDGTEGADPSEQPTQVVTDVPPQDVKDAKKLMILTVG